MAEKKKTVNGFSMDLDEVEEIFDKLMNSMMEKLPEEKQPFMMGFTINFGSDVPVIEEIREIEKETELDKRFVAKNLKNSLAEAHYFDEEVLVSFELPKNISRKDLIVDVTENSVLVKSRKKSFSRNLLLKEKINPRNFSSNLNNSFLELTFKKK
ncbi:MAG: Hsp20/alpha crystallin family protein [archaeon]